ncbi:MAG: hypothetical protein HQL27_09615 [Candidatus Omnitrophica bacterium]|nr:hypothetical protein [Candidatus Omnitrophota bacterium]
MVINKRLKMIFAILAVFVFLAFAKDQIIKNIITAGAKIVLGTDAKIGSFSLGIINQKVSMKDFRLYQPKGFEKGILIDIPEVTVSYDLVSVIKGKLHLPLIIVNMKEMILVKNKEGLLNVDELKVVKQAKADSENKKKEEAPKEKPKKRSKAMEMQIDKMSLNVGKVILKDFSKGDKPEVQGFDVGINNKEFKDIKSAEQLSTLIMVEAMGPAGIKGAAIYAAATVLGVGFLPVGIVAVLVSKDTVSQELDVNYEKVYESANASIQYLGEFISEVKDKGIIKCKIAKSDVNVELTKISEAKTKISISARKPIAEGLLYDIVERIK